MGAADNYRRNWAKERYSVRGWLAWGAAFAVIAIVAALGLALLSASSFVLLLLVTGVGAVACFVQAVRLERSR